MVHPAKKCKTEVEVSLSSGTPLLWEKQDTDAQL